MVLIINTIIKSMPIILHTIAIFFFIKNNLPSFKLPKVVFQISRKIICPDFLFYNVPFNPKSAALLFMPSIVSCNT